MRRPLFLILCLLALPVTLHAQWQKVGPTIDHPTYGAVHYKSGTVWVGGTDLFLSSDLGATWQPVSFPDLSGITDICFRNADTGIVGTLTNIWETTDRGARWFAIAPNNFQQMRVSFVGTSANIAAMAGGNLYLTKNGGRLWTTRPAGKYNLTFGVDRYGSLFFPDVATTDLGVTWSTLGAFPASSTDAWSIEVDSCDSRKMVVAVDNYYTNADGLCRIVNTTDGGASWKVVNWWKKPNLTGALATGPHTFFIGALSYVMRSTDGGASWRTMPGSPGTAPDSRAIAAISDNILFVLDAQGAIWKTENGGGNPLPETQSTPSPHSIAPTTLFTADTVRACTKDSALERVRLATQGCDAPVLSSVEIIGAGSANYAGYVEMPLVARIVFKPNASGLQTAKAVLHLSDNETDTVLLSGVAIAGSPVRAVVNNVNATTLGDVVNVPISVSGAPDAARIDFVLRYSSQLEYLGTFAPDNSPLDVQQWSDASRISAINHDGAVTAYARFRVYNDSGVTLKVTVDSIELPDIPNAECLYWGASASANILPPSSCGATMVSRFLHYGTRPKFRVVPNPSSESFGIIASENINDAKIEIFDLLGVKRFETNTSLSPNFASRIASELPAGIYNVSICAEDVRANVELIVR
jgi:photosystem II stability/assembly factor-like uncharacterized protein